MQITGRSFTKYIVIKLKYAYSNTNVNLKFNKENKIKKRQNKFLFCITVAIVSSFLLPEIHVRNLHYLLYIKMSREFSGHEVNFLGS